MNESECYYRPCSIDYDSNVFTSRLFSVHNEFEEVSLRDSVVWRIENPDISLGSIAFDFIVDLYCCKHPISNELENDILFNPVQVTQDCHKDDIVPFFVSSHSAHRLPTHLFPQRRCRKHPPRPPPPLLRKRRVRNPGDFYQHSSRRALQPSDAANRGSPFLPPIPLRHCPRAVSPTVSS